MRKIPTSPVPTPKQIRPLIGAICDRLEPSSVWLFGSRARGDNRDDSDWDVLVALPDDAPPANLDPLIGWALQRELSIPATIVTVTASELAESWGSPNTLGYDLAREGRLLHVRT
jgi:predicted nucleotidyltransferase